MGGNILKLALQYGKQLMPQYCYAKPACSNNVINPDNKTRRAFVAPHFIASYGKCYSLH